VRGWGVHFVHGSRLVLFSSSKVCHVVPEIGHIRQPILLALDFILPRRIDKALIVVTYPSVFFSER